MLIKLFKWLSSSLVALQNCFGCVGGGLEKSIDEISFIILSDHLTKFFDGFSVGLNPVKGCDGGGPVVINGYGLFGGRPSLALESSLTF